MANRMLSEDRTADPSTDVPDPNRSSRCRGVSLVRSLGTIMLLAAIAVVLPALAQSPGERRDDADLRGNGASDATSVKQAGKFLIAKREKRSNPSGQEIPGSKSRIAPLATITEEQRRDEIEQDLALYVQIAELPSGKERVSSSWKNLTEKYASSGDGIANLEVGYVPLLRMMLLEPLEFVPVKGGCFDMGDLFGDGGRDERPIHRVCLNDYAIGKFEVTQAQWEAVMGSNPSTFPQCGRNCPVESVSWNAVQQFIATLNARTGGSYRLPTEAEWEYAARSRGKRERFSGTSKEEELEDYAWFVRNSGSQTHPVGQKKPNGLGIHDMSGNVWEWVEDVYSDTAYRSDKDDRLLKENTANRVNRGGSWSFEPLSLRTTFRSYVYPGISSYYVGFRLVKTDGAAPGRTARRERPSLPQGTMNRSGTKIGS